MSLPRRFPQSTIDAVRAATDILAIASDHTELRETGDRWTGLCPFHEETTPSFSVDRTRGLFHCFGCDAGGNAIDLHMRLSGDDFPATIRALAERFGVALPKSLARSSTPLPSVLAEAEDFFRSALERNDPAGQALAARGISHDLVERYGLGFAPDAWDGLISALGPKRSIEQLDSAGLVTRSRRPPHRPYDRFRNRIMVPIRDRAGRTLAFAGRALGQTLPKYINSPETSWFKKGTLLFGVDRAKTAIRTRRSVVLVEGYFDVLAVAACGIDSVVASMGTSLTPEQVTQLAALAPEIIVAYDGDRAGDKAHRRALPLLLQHGLTVRRANFPNGNDPDSLRFSEGPSALATALDRATDAVVQELDRLASESRDGDPPAIAAAGRSAQNLLKAIDDDLLRFAYASQASERLQIPIDLLLSETSETTRSLALRS